MTAVPYFALVASALALLLAYYFAKTVLKADEGTDLMKEIGQAIREGAMAFLRREYQWVSAFVALMFVLLLIVPIEGRPSASFAYLMGAVLSSIAGFVGMRIATAANTRTANAAREGAAQALPLAFKGGAVMGFTVAGLALLGISFNYLLWVTWLGVDSAFQVVAAFGLGASSIALFARIGGGIYTKAADVGGDLVGKVEAGIPEDDPRNPATIADAVGDNVGDVAGMGADLFESYAGSVVAPIVLVSLLLSGVFIEGDKLQVFGDYESLLMYPILIGALGMIASIVGALLTRGKEGQSLSTQLHTGQYIAMGLTVIFTILGTQWLFGGASAADGSDIVQKPIFLSLTIIVGLLGGWGIGFVSEYFTSEHYKPVKGIAAQSDTGAATVTIEGIAQGKLSTLPSVVLVVTMIGLSYWLGGAAFGEAGDAIGLYGVSLAAIGMLAVTGVIVAVDAYGPIADNAGGIAEMAELPPEVREVTDSLDALGNTTAAVAKGFAVGSAAVTALALFKSFSLTAGISVLDINDTAVTIGLFLGAMTPFIFAAMTMSSVGRAAQAMIVEVRRQFAEIPGLREGQAGVKPDSRRCVDISTQAALREMLLPGGLAIVLPLAIGFIDVNALGGFLAGAVVTGFLLAIYMANSGGAWDNAKKYIEAGAHGGKGTDAHAAAVVGDTIGDPFKDTSGPAMNILIKVMTIVSLVFVPAFI
ncbi:MAG: potassium transporter [marine actinobacterium MedAcidi-G3]|nr:MAG: potassium transporter [marine actinobacterium MedAcidi-G3]MBA4813509.1 sodium-translocating pyrophosphatase [Acidimicrobiales bacterium]HCJ86451.1 sodium-translocating pyrophosphatase [Acidimicrobiaceae bacterium]